MQRNKIRLISGSAIVLISTLVMYRLGLFDRLHLRSNTFTYKCVQCDLSKYQVAFVEEGGKPNYFDLTQSTHFSFPDWYGKDRFEIVVNGQRAQVRFPYFKRDSWKKVKVHLILDESQPQPVHWYLETLWNHYNGETGGG